MKQHQGNLGAAKRLLTRLAALLSELAGKALGVPPGLQAIVGYLFDNTLDAICDDGAAATDARAAYARVLAQSTHRDVGVLKQAILEATGRVPQHKDELSRLSSVIDDPQGIEEQELLVSAVNDLFGQTGKTEDPNVLGQIIVERPGTLQITVSADQSVRTVQHQHVHVHGTAFFIAHVSGELTQDAMERAMKQAASKIEAEDETMDVKRHKTPTVSGEARQALESRRGREDSHGERQQ